MNPNEASANKTYNITTNGTTYIVGKVVLVRLVVNTKGSSSNTASIYDSNSTFGTDAARKKAKIDTTDSVGNIEYGFPCYKGILIVTETGTAGDLTVVYKEID